MDAIGTSIRTTAPVRRCPKFMQKRARKRLVQRDEGIFSCTVCAGIWVEKRQNPREGHRVTAGGVTRGAAAK